jgi:hypothetical protein
MLVLVKDDTPFFPVMSKALVRDAHEVRFIEFLVSLVTANFSTTYVCFVIVCFAQ